MLDMQKEVAEGFDRERLTDVQEQLHHLTDMYRV
jgi:hypothetical protein